MNAGRSHQADVLGEDTSLSAVGYLLVVPICALLAVLARDARLVSTPERLL